MIEVVTIDAADGLAIPVHVLGSGPPLVIVPGWTAAANHWEPLLRRLAPRFRCHIWDSRPALGGPDPGIPRMAADLRDLLAALDLPRPLVIGHSMGAMTVWEHVRQFGCGHLGGLGFIDQSPKIITNETWTLGLYGGFNAADNARFVQRLETDFTATVTDLIGSSRTTPPRGVVARLESRFQEQRRRHIAGLEPGPWIHSWRSFAAADCRDVPAMITVPTLLAYGACSAFYGPRVALWLHERIRGSRLHLYGEAGHSPQLEAMDAFVHDLAAFAW